MANDYKNRSQRHQQSRSSNHRHSGGGNALSWILAGILIGVLVGGIAYLKLQGLRVMTPETTTEANVQAKTEKTKSEPKKEVVPTKPPQPHFDFYTMLPKVDSAATAAGTKAIQSVQAEPPALLPPDHEHLAKTTSTTQPAESNEPPPDDAINQVVAKIEQKEKAEKARVAAKKETQPVELVNSSTDYKNEQSIKKDKTKLPQLSKETEKHAVVDVITLEKQRLEQELSKQVDVSDKATKPSAGHVMLALGTFKEQKAAEQQKAYLLLEGFNISIKKIKKGGVILYRLLMGPYATTQAAKEEQKRLQEQSQIDSVITKSNDIFIP